MPTAIDQQSVSSWLKILDSLRSFAAKVFSFPVMCMFLLGAVIFGFAPRGIGVGEPDIWWRLRNGADIWQHHRIPSVDTYSFTSAGLHWTSFEWVSDVLFFLSYRAMSLEGIVVVYSIAMVLIFAGVYYRSWRAGADCKDAAVATLGGICLGAVSLAPRPVLFGWVCLTVMLLVLDHFRRTGKGLWVLPPLFLVWINLHGSWIYGMVILVMTIGSGLVREHWGLVVADRWKPTELKKLLLTWVASTVALLVNPYGYKLLLYPFLFQLHFQSVMQFSEYWRPVDFNTWNGKLALILIFILLAAALFSRRPWRLDDVLLSAFALWSALSHVRFLDLAAIIIVPILAPRLRLFPPYDPDLDKPWLNAIIIATIVTTVIYVYPSNATLRERVDSEYPTAALEFMEAQHISGRLFHQHEFGGYLEWKAPQIKSFIDGRDEIYLANNTFNDYVSAVQMIRPLEVLDKHRIDYVLVAPVQPLTYVLEHSPTWRPIYRDRVAILFQRVAAN